MLDMSEKDIVDILEVRSALEGLATSLACKKMKREDLQKLKAMEADFEQAVSERNVERFVEIDEEFHLPLPHGTCQTGFCDDDDCGTPQEHYPRNRKQGFRGRFYCCTQPY